MTRPFMNWRILATIAVVSMILGVALWPGAVEIDIARAARGPLQVTIDEEGETRVRDRFVVSAPVAGRLQRIELEPGDAVVRGRTVLARLTPAPPTLLDARTQAELAGAVESARAAVGQARADRERAAATLGRGQSLQRRQQELATAGAISRDELEATEAALRTSEEALKGADFIVNRAEYDLQIARARLQLPGPGGAPGAASAPPPPGGRLVAIVSPIDGVVLKRVRESESVVQAGEPLIEVGNPHRLEIVADLLSTDAVRVPPNARVLIEQWGGSHALEGRVRRVEPSGFTKVSALGVEEQRVNVIIDFLDPATASRWLGDSYRVEVRIVAWEQPDVLKVPVGGLFRRGDGWAVFVVDNGRARTRLVELGQRNSTEAQVTKGLEAAQPVVLHPPDTLRDGVRITARTVS